MSTESPKDTKVTPKISVMSRLRLIMLSLLSCWKHILCGFGMLVISFFILVCCLPTPYYTTGFRTLSEVKAHADTLDEWIKMENDNELLPRYDNYYQQKFSRTLWSRWKEKCVWLLSRLHIVDQPPFSSSFFKKILEDVLKDRLKRGWSGDIVQKFEVKPTSKVIVFGVVQGAFHSLTRDLNKLKDLDILDENLRFKSLDYYMVFLGNVINRSPYTLDTFAVVLRLLQQNPENVIYLRGTNEFFDYWKDHTLRQELEYCCSHLSKEKIPLSSSVNKFFDTLPITLYATMPSWSSGDLLNYIRIAPFIGDRRLLNMLNEDSYPDFLLKASKNRLSTFDLQKQFVSSRVEKPKIVLRAVVQDILKRDFFEPTDGLRLLSPVDGVIAWNVISAPTEPYNRIYNFFNDSFVLLSPVLLLDQWTVRVFTRHIKAINTKLTEKTQYLFFSGEKVDKLFR